MQSDDQLRRTLLSRVRMFFERRAGAADLGQFYASAEREVASASRMTTSPGMIEVGAVRSVTSPHIRAGELGCRDAGYGNQE